MLKRKIIKLFECYCCIINFWITKMIILCLKCFCLFGIHQAVLKEAFNGDWLNMENQNYNKFRPQPQGLKYCLLCYFVWKTLQINKASNRNHVHYLLMELWKIKTANQYINLRQLHNDEHRKLSSRVCIEAVFINI